ncbi:MAG TPA: M1 family aminopeptidase [Pyrinomonadaceae bacterium]|jgi:hypothetical protein
MKHLCFVPKKYRFLPGVCLVLLFFALTGAAQENGRLIYNQIKTFTLNGGKAEVSNLVLKRDRVEMTFTGTFYFTSAVAGKVTGAVFIGQGNFKAELPPSEFEKNNVKRLLNAETVESDFKTAVFRFTDNTFDIVGKNRQDAAADAQAQKMALDADARIMKETGGNLASRLAISILNKENPGFFFATFDGGKRDRFSYVLDYQNRVPTQFFEVNGGEKGMIFDYKSGIYTNEIWLAFYALEDYKAGVVAYSDTNDLVDVTNYKMELDLRAPKTRLGLKTKISMTTLPADVSAIIFNIGESLSEYEGQRLKKQLRLKAARLGGENLEFVQEDWESALTVFLPKAVPAGQNLELELELEGDFIEQPESVQDTHYPRSSESWYPRHGYLDRATYDMTFLHSKSLKIAAPGARLSEEISPDDKNVMVTKYKMDFPVSLMTFALAPFERKTELIKWDSGDPPTTLEYNSLSYVQIKEDFIMAELNNSVRYFNAMFGKYPYGNYGATFHPFDYGQGFPSMAMIPAADRATKYTYAFIAHETAHQWWGHVVAWRSYRDQWLSEGFAEYSGVLYTAFRKDYKASINLMNEMRDSLEKPPINEVGLGKGKLADIGPLVLGHRLNTTKSFGAYNTLIYNKGALVLRMLHFLFTDPTTGNGDAFFEMMRDFVERYRNKVASTEDFIRVANEHFVKTPNAKKFGLTNLSWFFRQWVYESSLPSYTLDYTLEDQPDGTCVIKGVLTQENAPENWAMILPVNFSFGGESVARTTVAAIGPKSNFSIKLPRRPQKAELDPQRWVLSEKTKTN